MQRQLWCLYWAQHHGHHRKVTVNRRPRGTAVATRIPRRPTPPAHARSPQSRDLGPNRSLGQSPAATIRPATRSPRAAGHAVAGREGGGRSRRSADRRPAQLRGGAAPSEKKNTSSLKSSNPGDQKVSLHGVTKPNFCQIKRNTSDRTNVNVHRGLLETWSTAAGSDIALPHDHTLSKLPGN